MPFRLPSNWLLARSSDCLQTAYKQSSDWLLTHSYYYVIIRRRERADITCSCG